MQNFVGQIRLVLLDTYQGNPFNFKILEKSPDNHILTVIGSLF